MIKALPIGLILTIFSLSAFAKPERLEIELADSSTIMTYLLFPQEQTNTALPLIILMPPGSGEAALAYDLQSWLGEEMAQRGWAVAVPVSPDQKSFRGANNLLSGKVVLAGVSNGGISALEIAGTAPERVMGVVGVPALVSSQTKLDGLAALPVYLRIGDQDELMWMNRFEETKNTLIEAGAVVDADLLFMSPHMFTIDWENLDPWLQTIKQAFFNQ